MKSELSISKILLQESSVELNPAIFPVDEELDIDIEYGINFAKKADDSNSGLVKLSCHITEVVPKVDSKSDTQAEQPKLDLYVKYVGYFEAEQDIEMFFLNATSILFPYLRAHVSYITGEIGIPRITLPPVNIIDLVKESQDSSASI